MQKLQRVATSLFLFALFLSATFPFFRTFEKVNPEEKALAELFGGKVLICTAGNHKNISFKDYHKEDDEPHSCHCPLCIVNNVTEFDFTPLAAEVIVAYIPGPASFQPLHQDTVPSLFVRSLVNARAPPAFV